MEKIIKVITEEKLNELIQKGKNQNGILTYSDILDIPEAENISPEEIEHIYETLGKLNIELVDDTEDIDNTSTHDDETSADIDEINADIDEESMRIYSEEIRSKHMLDDYDEIKLIKRMEKGRLAEKLLAGDDFSRGALFSETNENIDCVLKQCKDSILKEWSVTKLRSVNYVFDEIKARNKENNFYTFDDNEDLMRELTGYERMRLQRLIEKEHCITGEYDIWKSDNYNTNEGRNFLRTIKTLLNITRSRLAKDKVDSIEITKKILDVEEDYNNLLKVIIAQGKAAKNVLFESNLDFVMMIAKSFVDRGMPYMDLVQEGNLGLFKAIDSFDSNKGSSFSRYAVKVIICSINRAIANQARTIRVPVHMTETINKFKCVFRQLFQELGREPSPEEMAMEMDTSVERVLEIMEIAEETVSMETPIGEDSYLCDFVEDYDSSASTNIASFTLLREQLEEVMTTLTEREKKVLELRFGLDDGRSRTLEEVGQHFGVVRERIRQIEVKALRKLRHPSRSKKLKDFLE